MSSSCIIPQYASPVTRSLPSFLPASYSCSPRRDPRHLSLRHIPPHPIPPVHLPSPSPRIPFPIQRPPRRGAQTGGAWALAWAVRASASAAAPCGAAGYLRVDMTAAWIWGSYLHLWRGRDRGMRENERWTGKLKILEDSHQKQGPQVRRAATARTVSLPINALVFSGCLPTNLHAEDGVPWRGNSAGRGGVVSGMLGMGFHVRSRIERWDG